MAKNRPSRREFALLVTSALGAGTVAAQAEPRLFNQQRSYPSPEKASYVDRWRLRQRDAEAGEVPTTPTDPATPPPTPAPGTPTTNPPVTPPTTSPTGLAFRSQCLSGKWQGARWPMADDICQKAFAVASTPTPHLRLGLEFGVKQGVARQDARKAFASLWDGKRLNFRRGVRVPAVLSNYDLPGGIIFIDASYDGPPITFDNWRVDCAQHGFGYNKIPQCTVQIKLQRCEFFSSLPTQQNAAGLVRLGTNDRLETSYLHHSGSDFVKFGDGVSNIQIVQCLFRYGGLKAGAHFDAIQIHANIANLLVDQNVIYAPARSSPYYEGGANFVSAVRLAPHNSGAKASNITVSRNLCLGWGQVFSIETANGGSVHSAIYNGNVLGDVGTWAEYMLLSKALRTSYNPSIHNVLFVNNKLVDGSEPIFLVKGQPSSTLNGLFNLDRKDSLAAPVLQAAQSAGLLSASNVPLVSSLIYWTMR